MGHLHALWHAALEQQEDGDLTSWSDELIAEMASFPGDAPQFVRLLQQHKWLDGRLIHDWLDFAGRYLESKYQSGNHPLLKMIWRKHGRTYGKMKKATMNAGWFRLRREILARDNSTCGYCGKKNATHVDHKIPRSKGGTDDKDNLITACKGCNIGKKNKIIEVSSQDGLASITRPSTLPNLTLPNQPDLTKEKEEKRAYGEFKRVLLKDDEMKKLTELFGESGANEKITELDLALESKPKYRKQFASHYATILSWDKRKNLVIKKQKTWLEKMEEEDAAKNEQKNV